ncbi:MULTISPECIES: PIN-like domain-containing protein [Priestia]|uniref:PIN-like domain-containing protein n=1 Tax=Priestia TaxID=2800373 RepID=UPI002D7F8AF1|nr:PIN-like domain-containing protein [Priestia megaterium]MEB4872138.1 PIN-like domain-containing protein [Priestia megaterium]
MFAGLIDYSEEDYQELWNEAIFVVDTNILVNFYKFTSKENTTKLFEILTDLKKEGRLWIPHQVALEYFFNYENNLNKPREGYTLLKEKISKIEGEIQKIFDTVKSQHSYITTDRFRFILDDLKATNEKAQQLIKEEIDSLPDPNVTKDKIYNLLENIVGQPYDQQEIIQIEKEGEYRYEHNIPPGFGDIEKKKKLGSRVFGNLKYERLYGDLIVWKQIIDHIKAKDESVPVIFITEDKKEDWWEKEGTNIKRPHPLLIQEFMQETKQQFYIYRTDSFVRYAKQYLDIEVTNDEQESINRDVNNIRLSIEVEENSLSGLNQYGTGLLSFLKFQSTEDEQELLSKVLMYLDDKDLQVYNDKIIEINKIDKKPYFKELESTKVRRFALQAAIPNMIDRAKLIMATLEFTGFGKLVKKAKTILNNLPEDKIETVKVLDELINNLQTKRF